MAFSREDALFALNGHGQNAGADFNDGDETPGWFGWYITLNARGEYVLTISYEDVDSEDPPVEFEWTLTEPL